MVGEENKSRELIYKRTRNGGVWRCVWHTGSDKKCVCQSKRRARKSGPLCYQYGAVLSQTTAKVSCNSYQKEANMHKSWRMLWLYQNRSCRPISMVTERRNMTVCMCRWWSFSLWLCFRATQLRSFCRGNGYIQIHRDTNELVGNREWMKLGLVYEGVCVSPLS